MFVLDEHTTNQIAAHHLLFFAFFALAGSGAGEGARAGCEEQ